MIRGTSCLSKYPQLVVDQGQELIGGTRIARFDLE